MDGPVDDDLVVPCEIYSHVSYQTPDIFRIRFRIWFFRWILVEISVWTGTGTAREFGILSVFTFWITSSCLWEGSCPVYVMCACVRIVVSNTHCVVLLFFIVLCALCCQFLWILNFWLPLRYSLTFIYYTTCIYNGFSLRFRTRFF